MGATLNISRELRAYTISDRATWMAFARKGDLKILLEGDPRLFNQYGVVAVDPNRHPHVKSEDAQEFVSWLLASTGQSAIASFEVDGTQLFFPNANSP